MSSYFLKNSPYASKIIFAISLIFFIGLIQLPTGKAQTGLDASRIYTLNVYQSYGLEFGRDLIHVFGPLGYLLTPIAIKNNLFYACFFRIALYLVLLGYLTTTAIRENKYINIAFILIIFATFSLDFFNLNLETSIYPICLIFYLEDMRKPHRWLFLGPVFLTGGLFFAKFNLGITLLAMFGVYLALVHFYQSHTIKQTALGVLLLLVCGVGVAALNFSSWANFNQWLIGSWELAKGNSEAMSRPGNDIELMLALANICLLPAIAGYIYYQQKSLKWAVVWFSLTIIPVFFEFKHSFVRPDQHIYYFFYLIPVAASTCLLLIPLKKVWGGLGLIIVLAIVGPMIRFESVTPLNKLNFSGVRALINLDTLNQTQQKINDEMLKLHRLSNQEITQIGSQTVEVVPWEITLLHDTGLKWQPSPFFQYFLVRNQFTDALNSQHLQSDRAATYMIWQWQTIDQKHPLLEAPLTYLSILNNYTFVSQTAERLLLKRAPNDRFVKRYLASTKAKWNEPIPLPDSKTMVVAAIHTQYTLIGQILRAVYRTAPVFIELGGQDIYRFVPATAENGLLLNYLPRNTKQFRSLLEKHQIHPQSPKVTSFQLIQNSRLHYFADEVQVDFYALDIKTGD